MARVSAIVAAIVVAGAVAASGAPGKAVDWSGPITISSGGTYTGNWLSTDSTPAVQITTAEPVAIVDSAVSNIGGGVLISAPYSAPTNVTLDHVTAQGGNGRFYDAEGFKSIVIRNCTIDRTSGIKLVSPVAGSSVLVARNRQRNILRGAGGYPGNFVQLVSVQTARVEISWNEILNQYDRSDPEDLISIYQSSHVRLHDNYFQHQSTPGNAYDTSSQNGVTIEAGSGAPETVDNEVWNNQLVDGMGIAIFGGRGNFVHDNRIVQDGKLPNGAQMGNGYRGMWIAPDAVGNRAVRNLVGYVNRDRRRNDFAFPGAPTDYALNTHIQGKVTLARERSEWKLWRVKLARRHVVVGA